MKQTTSFKNDMVSYEILKGLRARLSTSPFSIVSRDTANSDDLDAGVSQRVDSDLAYNWYQLGKEFLSSSQNELALEQFTQLLANDPESIEAHWGRAVALTRLKRDGSIREYARVVEHPQVEAWIQKYPTGVYAFENVAMDLIDHDGAIAAVDTARRGSALADLHKKYQARLHFVLARAYAHASRDNPSLDRLVLDELRIAHAFRDENFMTWLASDPVFQAYRIEFARAQFVGRSPD
jgi:hypothetical protein